MAGTGIALAELSVSFAPPGAATNAANYILQEAARNRDRIEQSVALKHAAAKREISGASMSDTSADQEGEEKPPFFPKEGKGPFTPQEARDDVLGTGHGQQQDAARKTAKKPEDS